MKIEPRVSCSRAAWIVLFLFAYFGSLIPFVKSWQPLRFKVPLDLFLALAASYIVAMMG